MRQVFIILSTIISFSAFSLSPKEIYKNSLKHVGKVITPIGHGSGFFLEDGVFATNVHVISGVQDKDISVELSSGDKFQKPIRIYSNTDEDIAFLYFKNPPSGFRLSRHLEIADKVYVLGNPSSLNFSITDGIVSRLSTIEDVEKIQFTAPILPGSSGSPIINEDGAVVGIVHSMHVKDPENPRGEQNFNFGTSYKNILKAIKTTQELLKNFSNLKKECPSFAYSCLRLGNLLANSGLFEQSIEPLENGCRRGLIKACAEARTIELTLGVIDIDNYKIEIEKLCFKKHEESCKMLKIIQSNTMLLGNVLTMNDFDITFPSEFKIYHKNVWSMVKDKVLNKRKKEENYDFGGWATKKSILTGNSTSKIYTFIRKEKFDNEFVSLFRSIKIQDVADILRKEEVSSLKKISEDAVVTTEKVKKTFPYSFVTKTKYDNGTMKKDLFILADSKEMLIITFSGNEKEESSINSLIKTTLRNIKIKAKTQPLIFDAGEKIRLVGYWISAVMFSLFFLVYIIKRRHIIMIKLLRRRIN